MAHGDKNKIIRRRILWLCVLPLACPVFGARPAAAAAEGFSYEKARARSGWVQEGDDRYFLLKSGAKAAGWVYDGGAMVTGMYEIEELREAFADSGEWLYTDDGE